MPMLSQSILLLCLASASFVVSEDVDTENVRFSYTQTGKILLSRNDVWEVGGPNMFAILMLKQSFTINISLVGKRNQQIGYSAVLKYKCPDTSAGLDLDLSAVTGRELQCENTMIPFSLQPVKGKPNAFKFILEPSSLPSVDVFRKKLELSVQVRVSGQPDLKLQSNSVFVWSLEPLGNWNSEPVSGSNVMLRFLTPEAYEFLINFRMASDFGTVKFIDQSIVSALKSAPAFLRSKINIGGLLSFDALPCDRSQMISTATFANYHSNLEEVGRRLLKHMHLNLATGELHYAAYGLSSIVASMFDKMSSSQFSICATLSFSGQLKPYDSTLAIKQRISKYEVMYTRQGTNAGCKLPANLSNDPIFIFSGMDTTPLVCPIICTDPLTTYKFTHISKDNNRRTLVPSASIDWANVDGIRVSKAGNVIEFTETVDNSHSGQYTCEAGGVSFTFNVHIVSMPHFSYKPFQSSSVVSGNLPPRIYAMEGESMSYNCTTFFSNLDQVVASAVFSTSVVREASAWKELQLNEFNSLFSPRQPVIVDTVTSVPGRRTINITIDSVPPRKSSMGRDFSHRIVCRATVSPGDAEKIGMPKYSVESGSNVFFLQRPGPESFDLSMARNCSMQHCSTITGAEFAVAFKPELTAYLKQIDVEVVAMFKIDNVYLTDLAIINQPGVSEILFDSNTNRLSFKVLPISDEKVLAELQKRKTLTPVFNLRYRPGSGSLADLANLRMHKDRYGSKDVAAGDKDCRADPRCFYSTDFDVTSSLQSIVMSIDFQGKAMPLEAASASTSLVIGLLAAALLLLLIAALLLFLLRRDTGQTYMLDEKERQQGNHPQLEAKEEQFKEYQRPEEGGLKASRLSLGSSISAESKDDQELDEYDNDIDVGRYEEDGSFIGGYTTDPKKRTAFNAHQV